MGSQSRHGEASRPWRSIRLLGTRIDQVGVDDVLGFALSAAADRSYATILYVNVHCMNVAWHDAEYRRILEEADLVYCDGTGVRLGAVLSGQYLPARMTGADWIHDLCRLAVQEDLSLFFLGGRSGAAERSRLVLSQRYPGLRVVGSAGGYEPGSETIEAINRSRADVLLVGMGTPSQEKWIQEQRAHLSVPVVWAVGALFDFISGDIPRGPRFMTDHGLEWLCRLAVEPHKLWRRYLIGNPAFIWHIVRHYWLHQPVQAGG